MAILDEDINVYYDMGLKELNTLASMTSLRYIHILFLSLFI